MATTLSNEELSTAIRLLQQLLATLQENVAGKADKQTLNHDMILLEQRIIDLEGEVDTLHDSLESIQEILDEE